jgi:Mlc titration factor MtfA (ptsG expression regulator)
MLRFRKRRRAKLRQTPLPPRLRAILDERVPYLRRLSSGERRELEGLVQVFLDEKRFEGAAGLVVTDEMRVTIAAQACVLLLGRETEMYPTLRTILVYPGPYLVHAVRRQPDGTVVENDEVRLGESHLRDTVVLGWDAVLRSTSDVNDCRNVVFHEFAHQLDNESGAAEGAPALPRTSMYIAWARVLGGEYRALVEAVERHRPHVLDAYGATSPAEFFAVATECFLNEPGALKARHPDLYDQLRLFYGRDPASSSGPEPAERDDAPGKGSRP